VIVVAPPATATGPAPIAATPSRTCGAALNTSSFVPSPARAFCAAAMMTSSSAPMRA